MARGTITIRLKVGKKLCLAADSADINEGVLRPLVYTNDRSKLLVTDAIDVSRISWARLSNGTYVVGSDEQAAREPATL